MPLHRARRPAIDSARRVRLTAAVAAARTALEASRPADDADDADSTAPLTALRLRLSQARPRRAEEVVPYEPGMLSGAVRGLLVTPWFAAATGLVVAAGLWIYSPHAVLRFPPSAAGGVPCEPHNCGVGPANGGGALTTVTRQPIAHAKTGKSGTRSDVDAGSVVSGLTFSYKVLWQSDGKFGVEVSVTGRRVPRAWKLAFAMPGDQIIDVMGANWQPAGSDAGTASGPSDSWSGQWQGQGPGQGQDPGPGQYNHQRGVEADQSRHHRRHAISFMVVGQGTPVVPTGCSLNGASCSFS